MPTKHAKDLFTTLAIPVRRLRLSHAAEWGKIAALGSLALATLSLAACAPGDPALAARAEGAMSATPPAVVLAAAGITATAPGALNMTPAAATMPPATAVATAESTRTAASEGLRSAGYQGISFAYPARLAQDVKGEVVAAGEGAGEPPWTLPVPQHVEITLSGYVLPTTLQKARIIVYPADEFAAGNPEAAGRIASLRQLLQKGAVDPGVELLFLPLINAKLSIQAGVKFLPFQDGHGVRYLTQLSQGLVPINNEELFYTFQGLTDDGRFYVAAILPVSQSLLPGSAESMAQTEKEAIWANFRKYLEDTTQALNAQSDANFTPALTDLDALVGSIKASGPTGQSLAGRVQWGSKPVAGVRVELRQPGWRNHPSPNNVAATTVSNAEGQYIFQNPPAGDWSLCAVWPDGEESQGGTPAVQIAAGQAIPTGPDTNLKLARTLKLIDPALGVKVDPSPMLRWEGFPGVTRFRVLVIDAGSTALVVDQVVTGATYKVTPALPPGSKYQISISALDAADNQLAIAGGEFWTAGVAPTVTPDPRGTAVESLPPDCQPRTVPDSALYAEANGRYCFLYPARFKIELSNLGQMDVELGLLGPALDSSPDPLRATMLLAVTPVQPGTDLKTAVDGFLTQFQGMQVPAIERKPFAMGGGPAELLEVVPVRTGSRDIFALNNRGDRLYHFIFMPSVRDFPKAQADADELFNTIAGHFAFLMP